MRFTGKDIATLATIAIQGLELMTSRKQKDRLIELEVENRLLKEQLTELKTKLTALEYR